MINCSAMLIVCSMFLACLTRVPDGCNTSPRADFARLPQTPGFPSCGWSFAQVATRRIEPLSVGLLVGVGHNRVVIAHRPAQRAISVAVSQCHNVTLPMDAPARLLWFCRGRGAHSPFCEGQPGLSGLALRFRVGGFVCHTRDGLTQRGNDLRQPEKCRRWPADLNRR
jgi:hypothetical protein